MRRASPGLALPFAVVVVLPLVAAGCLSDDTSDQSGDLDAGAIDASVPIVLPDGAQPDRTVNDAGHDAGDATLGGDTGAGDDASDAAPDAFDAGPPLDAGTATLRFVNLVPDLGTAVDLCAAPQGQALQGPFLKLAGVPAGLAYGEMTQYVTTPIATHFTVRVVAANAADCNTPLVPDVTALPITIAARATVALMGSAADGGANKPGLQAFPDDDPTGFPTQGGRVRIVHAAPASPATDFVIGAGAYTFPQHASVAYGAAISPATQAAGAFATDANGYFVTNVYTSQVTATHAGGDVTSFVVYLVHGVSAFFVGIEGSATTPPGFVVCDDTASPTNFKLPCTLRTGAPTLTPWRIVQGSSDLGAVDFCVRIQHSTTPFGPLLAGAGVTGGLAYERMSGTLPSFPSDTSFDAPLVTPGAGCGSTPVGTAFNAFFYGQPGVTDQTMVLSTQYYPPAQGGPVHGLTASYTSSVPNAADATLYFTFLDWNDDPVNDRLNVYDTPNGGSETSLFPGVYPWGANAVHAMTPGTYGMRVEWAGGDGGLATTYTGSGITLGAGSRWIFNYVQTSETARTMVRCDMAAPDAGTVTTCLQ